MLSRKLVIVVIAGLLSFIGCAFAASEKKQQTEQQLQAVKSKIQQLKKQLDRKRKQYGSATQSLRKTEKQINSAAKILRATQRQIQSEEKQLKNNRAKEQQLEKQREKHQQLLAHQIRSAYSSGRQEYLKLLLNQEQPAKLGRVLTYYEYLNKARTESIRELGETIVELNNVQVSIQNNIKELALLEAAQKEEQKRLLGLKERRKKEVASLASSIKSEDKRLLSLREDEEELESLLQQMQRALEEIIQQQDLEGLRKVKGKLTWPVKGKLVQNYGERINRDIRSNGIRIRAQEGKEVAAVYHGRVVFSDWLRGFGLLVIVDHGDGYMSLYGNNQSLFKDVGDWVEAGEMLATVGQSGGQRSPGLYFEIRHQGKARNPMQWIRG